MAMLANVDLFRECSTKELTQILAVSKEIGFPAGKDITVEGQLSGRFYLVLDGAVAVKRQGRTRATLGPGSYFGEIALIDGGPRTATCTAVTSVDTLAIAQFNFGPLVKEHPGLAHKLLLHLCARLRAAEAQLLD